MAKQHTPAPEDRDHAREMELVSELRRLLSEDDAAGALRAIDLYPKLTRHELTEFERDLRDWGLVYGMAFGLSLEKWSDEPHDELASRAFDAARMAYVRWSGEIQDPDLRREAAIRTLLERYDERSDARDQVAAAGGQYVPLEQAPMGKSLSNALDELREAVA